MTVFRDEKRENEDLETAVIVDTCNVVYHMQAIDSRLPREHFEKRLRPQLRAAFLQVRIEEAERCEAYDRIGSFRVRDLKQRLERVKLEIVKLPGEK